MNAFQKLKQKKRRQSFPDSESKYTYEFASLIPFFIPRQLDWKCSRHNVIEWNAKIMLWSRSLNFSSFFIVNILVFMIALIWKTGIILAKLSKWSHQTLMILIQCCHWSSTKLLWTQIQCYVKCQRKIHVKQSNEWGQVWNLSKNSKVQRDAKYLPMTPAMVHIHFKQSTTFINLKHWKQLVNFFLSSETRREMKNQAKHTNIRNFLSYRSFLDPSKHFLQPKTMGKRHLASFSSIRFSVLVSSPNWIASAWQMSLEYRSTGNVRN